VTSPIGLARPRPDAPAKARGATRYAADRRIHGLLRARLVLATHAHARIAAIEASAALATPGVVAVLRAADLPIAATGRDRLTVPLARSEVVFAGQPVALVVADSEAAAEDGAELVEVRLEPLPVVLEPEDAMDPGSPLAWREIAEEGDRTGSMDAQSHAAVGGGEDASIESEELSANVVGRSRYWDGDVSAALDAAAVVREGRFTTSWIHQGYLEPQACTAWVDPDGTIVLESATQAMFGSRNEVAKALGLDQRQVRVVATTLGGAFGGKWPLLDTLVAAAAVKLRRPVRLVVTRAEDFAAMNPSQSFVTELRIGADRDGTFRGLECRMIADTGAFDEGTAESLGGVLVAGPYSWPAFDVRAYGVRTNRFGVGAYRGPSAPPSAMALETLIDEVASELDIDPIDLRRRNLASEGAPMVDGETWPVTGGREVLDAMAASPVWHGRSRSAENEGVGLALGYWPGATNAAAAACRMSPDGSVQVLTGIVDMSGVTGGFQAIVAETLALRPDDVQLVFLDSSSAPTSPGSGGSQITYAAGRAIRKAAEATARLLLEAAALELEISVDDLELVGGTVRPRGTPERAIEIAKLVRANARAGRPPIEAHGATENPGIAPSVAGHIARVRVDRETGNIEVIEDHVVQDVGRVLNPALVAGQQHGGAAQAIGWATLEELRHDENGQLQTGTFLDYALPRAHDVGTLRATSVEVPAPEGPLGAKGIGEAPVIAGPAAIANAVAAATGIRLRDLPMSRTRVWSALHATATDG
jgi:CO/xanthine dehydrogenase Mo-binding subunit